MNAVEFRVNESYCPETKTFIQGKGRVHWPYTYVCIVNLKGVMYVSKLFFLAKHHAHLPQGGQSLIIVYTCTRFFISVFFIKSTHLVP
jgi:hypothetical protein